MGEKARKKYTINEIGQNIERLSQLQELTSIETILVTIWIAAIILGITLFVTVEDPIWKIVALFLIMLNITPILMFLSQFLSDAEYRFFNLKSILVIVALYLISIFLMIAFIYIIVQLQINSYVVPFFLLVIFESWGIFLYFWDTKFEKNLNNKLSHFLKDIKITNRYILKFAKIITYLSTKGLIWFIIVIISILCIWSIILNDILQVILIIIIGILDIGYIIYKRRIRGNDGDKKNNIADNKKKENELKIPDKKHDNGKNKVDKNAKLQFVQTIATLITVFLMLGSIYYSYNTAQLSQETVDWYKNPKPLLSHSSSPYFSLEDNIGLSIRAINNYDPMIGIQNNPYTKYSINISLYNSGRAPLKNARVKLNFEIYDWNPDKFPTFPFKILNFSTPYESFWFKQNSSNYSQNKILYHEKSFNRYINNFGAIDFPPTINYSSNDLKLNYPIPRLYLGSLGVEKETWIYVQLFAIAKEASGYLILEVTASNNSPYILKIPIESK